MKVSCKQTVVVSSSQRRLRDGVQEWEKLQEDAKVQKPETRQKVFGQHVDRQGWGGQHHRLLPRSSCGKCCQDRSYRSQGKSSGLIIIKMNFYWRSDGTKSQDYICLDLILNYSHYSLLTNKKCCKLWSKHRRPRRDSNSWSPVY